MIHVIGVCRRKLRVPEGQASVEAPKALSLRGFRSWSPPGRKGTSVRRNNMAEMSLRTNNRNNPGDIKGQMAEVTLF
jgi:hypothetical protein